MTQDNARLSAHCNSDLVTREQLAALHPVEGTHTFRPIQHIELVEGLEKAIGRAGLKLQSEQYALRRDAKILFGVLKVGYMGTDEFVTALGVRQGLDRTMSIQMCAGASVFVCDNLCFRGDMFVLKQRHTGDFELADELDEAVGRWKQHSNTLVGEIKDLKARGLSTSVAKSIILDAFCDKNIGMPTRLLQAVHDEYFSPRHKQFEPRNLWSLSNAFTEVQKQMPLTTRVMSSQELGKFMAEVVKES